MTGGDLVPIPQPWEHQPKEGVKAFEAFAIYRDAGANRSLARVASELGKSRALIERWSSEFHWQDRIYAYDIDIDRRRRRRREELQEEMLDRHRAAADGLMDLGLRRIFGDEGNEEEEIPPVAALDPNLMDAQDVASLVRLAHQMGRMNFGLPNDITKASYYIDPKEAEKLLAQVVDIGLRFCPPDDQEAYMREIRSVAAGS